MIAFILISFLSWNYCLTNSIPERTRLLETGTSVQIAGRNHPIYFSFKLKGEEIQRWTFTASAR